MALTALGERLALIIDGDTNGAVSAIRRLTIEEKAAADQAEVLKARITDLEARAARNPASASTGLALSKAKTQLAGLETSLTSVPQGAGVAERALGKLGLAGTVSSAALVSGFTAAAGAAAAFGGFEFLKTGVDEFTALAQSVRQFQQASGASAEDASKLVAVSGALGVSSQSLALGVFRLGKNISLQPQILAEYGVALARTKTGQVDLTGTLENVAAAYRHTTDATSRNALVYQAFGRAGTTLLPILNATRQQFGEILKQETERGHIFSQSDVNNAYQFQIATRELKDSFDSLAVSAAKTLVPALTDVSKLLTGISDGIHLVPNAIHSVSSHLPGPVKFGARRLADYVLPPLGLYDATKGIIGLFHHGGSSSGPSAEQTAARELHSQQIQAQQAQIEQTVLATLASPFDQLAGPLAVRTAKQTLSGALRTVTDAKREQSAALRELAKARQGTPVATEQQMTAAEASLRAAEARLKAARYVGGDKNIASAQASVASAQNTINRLRKQGGIDTGALANAEDRLKRANEGVSTAQKKAQQAQKKVNEAHGLDAKQVLKRITGQALNQQALAAANEKLAVAGVSSAVIVSLDQLNSQVPGTLKRVAASINKGLARELDHQESVLGAAQDLYKQVAADPKDFYRAGVAARKAFDQGWKGKGFKGLLTNPAQGGRHPSGNPSSYSNLMRGPVVQYRIDKLNLKAENPREMHRKLAAIARRRRLGSGQ